MNSPSPCNISSKSPKILLIEDDYVDAKFVTRSLMRWQPVVPTLSHQTDLISSTVNQQEQWEIVILDLSLKESNGLQTFFKAKELYPEALIVVLTGNEDVLIAKESVREGAQDFLIKGKINAYSFSNSVQNAIERFKSTQALRQSEERYARALEGAYEGIIDWNLNTDEIFLSPGLKALLGYTDSELANSVESWFDTIYVKDCDTFREKIKNFAGKKNILNINFALSINQGSYVG